MFPRFWGGGGGAAHYNPHGEHFLKSFKKSLKQGKKPEFLQITYGAHISKQSYKWGPYSRALIVGPNFVLLLGVSITDHNVEHGSCTYFSPPTAKAHGRCFLCSPYCPHYSVPGASFKKQPRVAELWARWRCYRSIMCCCSWGGTHGAEVIYLAHVGEVGGIRSIENGFVMWGWFIKGASASKQVSGLWGTSY